MDHRALGQQLDLFSIKEEIGIGLILWHPKGALVRRIIRDFWEEEHLNSGYQLVLLHMLLGENSGKLLDIWNTMLRTCTSSRRKENPMLLNP